jgi:very-short-patch-repair endonuclease
VPSSATAAQRALWGLLDQRGGPIEVSVPVAGGRKPRPGIRIHRRPGLQSGATTRRHNIPVTKPAQTIEDLRRRIPEAKLRSAIRAAEVQGLPTGLDTRTQAARSELEEIFLSLCRKHRLPMPQVNSRVATLEVDFLWPDQRLVVEADGYRFHRGSSAFETDHDRDLHLRAADYDVLRLTYRQITTKPTQVAALVRRELQRPRRS